MSVINSGQIWSYAVGAGGLSDAKLIRTFEPDTVDGLRSDVAGRIYVAHILRGAIAIMQPSGAARER
ncbi:sugar lactone lactonase YvrE [Bradyrhizobium sp. USDA 4532]|nr:sugar lactone lactonase YvrE [Bradyrhizobium sp. USDA 4545]MCP1920074.1 sugar lactone lactonase YvrE [Bradyrhizobium sp. USDA 4532]